MKLNRGRKIDDKKIKIGKDRDRDKDRESDKDKGIISVVASIKTAQVEEKNIRQVNPVQDLLK